MGIPKFYSWFKETFPKAFVPIKKKIDVEFLYFDMNGYLYTQRAKNEPHLIKTTYREIHDHLKNIASASNSIYLAMDGSAGWAKALVQRERREAALLKTSRSLKNKAVSNSTFTPGTKFMKSSPSWLGYFACGQLITGRERPDKFIVSGADVPGEGEHKLIQHLLARANTCADLNALESSMIVGGDADLLLMTVAAGAPNTLYFNTRERKEREMCVFSWNAFMKVLADEFRGDDIHRIRMDFVFISLFAGGDYLPKLAGSGIASVWESYVELKKGKLNSQFIYNPVRRTINMFFMKELVSRVFEKLAPPIKSALLKRQRPAPVTKDKLKRVFNEDESENDESEDGTDIEELDDEIVAKDVPPEIEQVMISRQTKGFRPSADPFLYFDGLIWTMNVFCGNTTFDFEYWPRNGISLVDVMNCISEHNLSEYSSRTGFNPKVLPMAASDAPALLIPAAQKNLAFHTEKSLKLAEIFVKQMVQDVKEFKAGSNPQLTRLAYIKSIKSIEAHKRELFGVPVTYTIALPKEIPFAMRQLPGFESEELFDDEYRQSFTPLKPRGKRIKLSNHQWHAIPGYWPKDLSFRFLQPNIL